MRPDRPTSRRLGVSILLALFLATGGAGPLAAQEGATLTGTVHGHLGERSVPLAHAWISVSGGARGLTAVSAADGRYSVTGVPPGERILRVSRLGYRPLTLEVTVPREGVLRLDLEVEATPIAVTGITVRPDPVPGPIRGSAAVSAGDVELGILEVGPGGGDAGLAAAARALAGGEGGSSGRRLLIRGSVADQKRVLVDGVPVHAPFHLGGLLPGLDEALFAEGRHHVGAAPASFQGGLSNVLDLHTRAPASEGLRGRATLDLATATATVEGPLGERASGLVSARALHGLGARGLGAGDLPYGYAELLARSRIRPGGGHRIDLTGYWNEESVGLDLGGAGLEGGGAGPVGTDEARWHNGAASLRWTIPAGESGLHLGLGASRYDAVLPLGRETPAWADGRTERLRASVQGSTAAGDWTVAWGGTGERVRHVSSARTLGGDGAQEVWRRVDGTVVGAFVEGRRPLGPDVTLQAGLRADRFSRDEASVRLAPRIRTEWLLTEDALLTLAFGKHYEFVQPADLEVQVALGDPGGTRAGQALYPVAGATHLVLSLEQHLTPDVFLGAEGFVKAFDGLPGVADGELRSSGVDLTVRRSGEKAGGWFGYSLAWFWSPTGTPTSAAGEAFTGRHLLSAGVDGRLGEHFGGEARLAYGDGLPFTSVPIFGGESPASPDEATTGEGDGGSGQPPSRGDAVTPTLDGFFRLDVEVDAEWDTRIAGAPATLRPYLRIVNALDRRDALFYYFEPWRSSEVEPLARRPFLPLLGLELRF